MNKIGKIGNILLVAQVLAWIAICLGVWLHKFHLIAFGIRIFGTWAQFILAGICLITFIQQKRMESSKRWIGFPIITILIGCLGIFLIAYYVEYQLIRNISQKFW